MQGATIDLAFRRVPERLFDEPDELIAWHRPRWPLRAGSQPNARDLTRPRENREQGRRNAVNSRDARKRAPE
ncbi:hypothetical protein [Bradyrhizobium uaiense]|uniref:Uncharacterized protein n=1 Tax=Bradyrhizobium uaiense TaxID=2594946 RepID=A0A6P1BVN1_9BRAD|nr:hypothetical protein [Bradyrhizobium uaiense]NEV02349.1 hypothetical protein [Bradyrhizobium uaiense]